MNSRNIMSITALMEIVRRRRREKDISQDELAKLIGVSSVSLGLWERRKVSPSGQNLLKMLLALKINLDLDTLE